jgi:hypothetical protein
MASAAASRGFEASLTIALPISSFLAAPASAKNCCVVSVISSGNSCSSIFTSARDNW